MKTPISPFMSVLVEKLAGADRWRGVFVLLFAIIATWCVPAPLVSVDRPTACNTEEGEGFADSGEACADGASCGVTYGARSRKLSRYLAGFRRFLGEALNVASHRFTRNHRAPDGHRLVNGLLAPRRC